jgi:hypothetical protein
MQQVVLNPQTSYPERPRPEITPVCSKTSVIRREPRPAAFGFTVHHWNTPQREYLIMFPLRGELHCTYNPP